MDVSLATNSIRCAAEASRPLKPLKPRSFLQILHLKPLKPRSFIRNSDAAPVEPLYSPHETPTGTLPHGAEDVAGLWLLLHPGPLRN